MPAGDITRRGLVLRFVLPFLVLAAAGAGAAWLIVSRPPVEAAPAEEKSYAVRVVEARQARFAPRIRHFGRLAATREVQLETAVAGRVQWVAPELVEGGEVAAGMPIVRLDPMFYETRLAELEADRRQAAARLAELEAELRSAEEAVEVAVTQLELAERELDRQRRLVARKVASPKAVDEAEAALLQRRSGLIDARRTVETLRQRIRQEEATLARLDAQLVWARRQLADTELRAPFDAIVASVEVVVGRELRANDPVARLFARDGIEIAFSFADAEFGRLWRDGLIGRPVEAVWRLGETGYRLEGRIVRIDDRIDRTAAGVAVYAAITANPDGAPLRPDAFLEVSVPDLVYDGVFVLPRTALFGDTVYVVENGRLAPRKVELVARSDGEVALRGALSEGDPVVVTRLAETGPGLKVGIVR